MYKNSKRFGYLILFVISHVALGATWEITFPRILSSNQTTEDYPVALLKLALQQTGVNFQLKPSENVLTPDKAMRQLIVNRDIDIAWSLTDEDKETDFLPIRVPIYKGLMGWQLFLISPAKEPQFLNIRDLEDLLKYKVTQRFNSPNAAVLQAKQFKVMTGVQDSNMFAQLEEGSVDFLPRSIINVRKDFDLWSQNQPLVIEKNIGLRYPLATYFFLNTRNVTLHRLIETGLNRAVENGEFDLLFEQYHQTTVQEFDIKNRQFFDLENPLLPQNTPIDNEALWFKAEKEL